MATSRQLISQATDWAVAHGFIKNKPLLVSRVVFELSPSTANFTCLFFLPQPSEHLTLYEYDGDFLTLQQLASRPLALEQISKEGFMDPDFSFIYMLLLDDEYVAKKRNEHKYYRDSIKVPALLAKGDEDNYFYFYCTVLNLPTGFWVSHTKVATLKAPANMFYMILSYVINHGSSFDVLESIQYNFEVNFSVSLKTLNLGLFATSDKASCSRTIPKEIVCNKFTLRNLLKSIAIENSDPIIDVFECVDYFHRKRACIFEVADVLTLLSITRLRGVFDFLIGLGYGPHVLVPDTTDTLFDFAVYRSNRNYVTDCILKIGIDHINIDKFSPQGDYYFTWRIINNICQNSKDEMSTLLLTSLVNNSMRLPFEIRIKLMIFLNKNESDRLNMCRAEISLFRDEYMNSSGLSVTMRFFISTYVRAVTLKSIGNNDLVDFAFSMARCVPILPPHVCRIVAENLDVASLKSLHSIFQRSVLV